MYSLYITPPLPACIVYDCREGHGVIYREYTECYSISFLFLFFFHQSSLYPIKIFAKCFYLLVSYIRCTLLLWPLLDSFIQKHPLHTGQTPSSKNFVCFSVLYSNTVTDFNRFFFNEKQTKGSRRGYVY